MMFKTERESNKDTLIEIYKDRFLKAKKGRGFHNCAGFTKYLLGLSETETFIRTGDSSEKGLIKHIEQTSILPLSEFKESIYLEMSRNADAVALLQNNNNRWTYLHFFVPNPDPKRPFEIYQRNGFEEEKAEIADVRDVITDDEYRGETSMVFFKKRQKQS